MNVVQSGFPSVGKGNDLADGGFRHLRQIQGDAFHDPVLERTDTGQLGDPIGHRDRRSLKGGENLGEAIAVVVGVSSKTQRPQRSLGSDKHRDPTTDHRSDGQCLTFHLEQVSKKLSMKGLHGGSCVER